MSALAVADTSYELPLRPFTAEQLERAFDAGLFLPSQVALRGDGLIDCATRQPYYWDGETYDHAIEIGVFYDGERAELIGGEVRLKLPQKLPHEFGLSATETALRPIFYGFAYLRIQMTLRVDPIAARNPILPLYAARFKTTAWLNRQQRC